MQKGWIGVDLDGTLAYYDGWRGIRHIGEPIPMMLGRVKEWLAEGKYDVKIFTARVCQPQDGYSVVEIKRIIQNWTKEYLDVRLPVTNEKDFAMVELWDDRCVRVIKNEGIVCTRPYNTK